MNAIRIGSAAFACGAAATIAMTAAKPSQARECDVISASPRTQKAYFRGTSLYAFDPTCLRFIGVFSKLSSPFFLAHRQNLSHFRGETASLHRLLINKGNTH
jgi:hypothetical protein